MNLVKDILPIFKKHDIYFKEKYREVGDIYTFIFEAEKEVNWRAGQHGIFTIKDRKISKPTRAFSIASIPSEGHIKISVKISDNPSAFKQVLLNLEPGMKLSMRGPIGSFYAEEQKTRLFIAGGIGITPYRALIKHILLDNRELSDDAQLLYLDSRKEYIYTKEFEEAGDLSSIRTSYLVERKNLNEEIEKFAAKHSNEAEYFVVGSRSMVKATETLLKNIGIRKSNIKKDAFIGY